MKEYIERAEAINAIRQYQYPYGVEFLLANIPAADVVEVARCDHCGRRYEEDGEYFCSRTDMPCADDDFCSHGARMGKEDEHDKHTSDPV